MSGNYIIEQIGRITAIRFTSPAFAQDLIDATDEVARFENNSLRLWDFTKGISLSSSDMIRIADLLKNIGFPSSKIAVLVNDKLGYGLARMLDVHREQDNQQYSVFETEQEAFKWLME